jgi:phenylalanyl-tRNA synthetase alpha chain
MQKNITFIQEEAILAIEKTNNIADLENIRIAYLGKKGKLTDILKSLGNLPASERPLVGQEINTVKHKISELIDNRYDVLKEEELKIKINEEQLDITLPGRNNHNGSIHPVNQIKYKINNYFYSLGFDIVEGPEIETEFYNFEALNIPTHHPARAMHDTFYFGDGSLLRTHTSPVQIRVLENNNPPLRLIAPGRVYRCDSDVTHTPMFHQVEGLVVDSDSTLASLKGILDDFFSHLFAKDMHTRFRPSYFPFTEPSAEIDLQCTKCEGKGCRICKFTGWLEVGGCGMVHPNVLKAVNIDPNKYQGWAFGMGIDRITMLYFEIDDLRTMFENDIVFLKQF